MLPLLESLRRRFSKQILLIVVGPLVLFTLSALLYLNTKTTTIFGSTSAKQQTTAINNNPSSASFLNSSKRLLKSPANSTLGFQKLFYINLDTRYDLEDMIQLQSDVAGITPDLWPARKIEPNSFKGLPPASDDWPSKVALGLLGCLRSHADIWRATLKEKWETVLILEADAAWDIHVREMMAHFSKGFQEALPALSALNITDSPMAPHGKPGDYVPTENDPYMAKHWDILQLGGCFEKKERAEFKHVYFDPTAHRKPIPYADGSELGSHERAIRWQNELMCTTAYAITPTGARKLLLRMSLQLNTPVDGLISELVREDKLRAYSTTPNVFIQWQYRDGLGSNNKNSDISKFNPGDDASQEARNRMWALARKEMKIWQYNGIFGMSGFLHPALGGQAEQLYGIVPS
ncbi:uncharacterized protein SAPINGB_P002495 [Magnusiomyces paraingens]|uniref:Glycosyl transferase family 25 domain-containing protein n=1 Tax=Magnusiomyces paraingens TaxID=2606893 RepID=A0A5E8BGA8_9ASCO|nr:uncharacterized protein SAPINGB_P002495 [Saprochaete ingens]VVT49891.1 unnamed protein product [Saprochaete ingens]